MNYCVYHKKMQDHEYFKTELKQFSHVLHKVEIA